MRRIAIAVAFALALAGCATGGIYGPAPRPAPQPDAPRDGASARIPDPAGERGRPSDGAGPSAGATAALVTQSRAERDTGNLGGAAATIERALTIAPEDAQLWMELAEIRMEQGDWDQAEEMARKALTLTAERSEVAERARRLLAQ